MKRNICSFRISAHRLKIERGRYTGKNIDERLCNHCNVIEDETHFLFECKKYEDIRKYMFKIINDTIFVLGKSLKEKLTSLLNCSNVIVIKTFGEFLKQSNVV